MGKLDCSECVNSRPNLATHVRVMFTTHVHVMFTTRVHVSLPLKFTVC
jgi:hypothetical protein